MQRLLAGIDTIQIANTSRLLRVIVWKYLFWRTASLIGDICSNCSTTTVSANNNDTIFEIAYQTSCWLKYMAANPVELKHEQSSNQVAVLSFEDVLNNALVLFRMICKQSGTLDHSSLYYFHNQIQNFLNTLSNFVLIDSNQNFTGLVSQISRLRSAVFHYTGHFMDKIWASMLPSKEVRSPIMSDAIERLFKFAYTFDEMRMFCRSMYIGMETYMLTSFQYLFRYCSSFPKNLFHFILN